MSSFRDHTTGERVFWWSEEIEESGLDGQAFLYKLMGPDFRFYSYRIEVAGTLVPVMERPADGVELVMRIDDRVQELVSAGEHRDLVTTLRSSGWGAPRAADSPLRKHEARNVLLRLDSLHEIPVEVEELAPGVDVHLLADSSTVPKAIVQEMFEAGLLDPTTREDGGGAWTLSELGQTILARLQQPRMFVDGEPAGYVRKRQLPAALEGQFEVDVYDADPVQLQKKVGGPQTHRIQIGETVFDGHIIRLVARPGAGGPTYSVRILANRQMPPHGQGDQILRQKR